MDTEQGLCLGALFDIAATNVNRLVYSYFYDSSGRFALSCVSCFGFIFLSFEICHCRDLIWAGGFVYLGFAGPLRC